MSGIAGIVSGDGAPPDASLLERFADALTFRGPDARRVWTGPGVGLCFTFLRTGPAPQSGEQPYTLNGCFWLLADARLDGREDLLSRLKAAGCILAERPTDEDLIFHAWQEWGETCLDFLRGDFAFVLWDTVRRTLWCARDPLGARPFYYARRPDQLYFSNTLNVLRLAPDVSAALDTRAVGDFLLEGWISGAERTIFRDLRRLPAGHLLRFANGEVRIRCYAKLPIEEPLELKRPEDYVEAFREVFTAAVRDRLPRGSAALFLSGGLDSTSVAAVAKSIAEKETMDCSLRAFTVDYRPLFEDEEGHLASRAAAHIGVPIEIFSGAACLPYARWGSGELHTPEPCHEPYLALQTDQYRQVAAHARVVLSGNGGDSVLSGQAWPHLVSLVWQRRMGSLVRVFGRYIVSHGRIPPLRGDFRARIRRWLGRRDANEDYPAWLNPEFEREQNLRDRWREIQQDSSSEHPLHPCAHGGLANSYWPSVFEQEDAGWTGVAVEPRTPFLDWRVLRFLLRTPPVPWCMEKELLRQSMRSLLPGEILSRPKTPLLGDPLALHLERGNWRPRQLVEAAPVIHQFVNWSKVAEALAAPSPGNLWLNLRPLSLNYWLKRELGFSRVGRGESG